MYTIDLPVFVQTSKKKKFYLNLNQYRNAHHFTLNKAKVLFNEQVTPTISHLPHLSRIGIMYRLFAGDKRSRDVANVCSIVDKFFCDCLVENKILDDDNFTILPECGYSFGGYAENTYVQAEIIPLSLGETQCA